jgi:hypothetical protein
MYVYFIPDDFSEFISLGQLAKELGLASSTVRQYASRGSRGVKLRVCRKPLGLCSSHHEYNRFLKELNLVYNPED